VSYENPPLPEGINVGREKPVAEFLRLAAGLAIVVVMLSAMLYLGGGTLARQIPFETERKWTGDRVLGVEAITKSADETVAIERALQSLAERVAGQMDLPSGMTVQVHYVTASTPNAFASLGGQIAVTSGLYQRMHSENAVAFVLGHEIGHVKARDPIAAVGGGAALGVMLALLSGDASSLSGAFAQVVQRGYSRSAEARADAAALDAVRRLYGHAGGTAEVFEELSRWTDQHGARAPSLLATHPLDADRIARLREAARDWDPARQPLLPLPAAPEKKHSDE